MLANICDSARAYRCIARMREDEALNILAESLFLVQGVLAQTMFLVEGVVVQCFWTLSLLAQNMILVQGVLI